MSGGIDIAQLGYSVDSTPIVEATKRLDEYTASGDRAAATNAKVAQSTSAAASAQTAAATATESAASSTSIAATAAERMLAAIQKQIDLFGASAEAAAAYNGSLAKMTEAENALYVARTLELEGLKEQAAAEAALASARNALLVSQTAFLDGLREELNTLGLSRAGLQAYKAEQLGIAEQAAPILAAIQARKVSLAEEAAAAEAAAKAEQDLAAAQAEAAEEASASARYQAIAAAGVEFAESNAVVAASVDKLGTSAAKSAAEIQLLIDAQNYAMSPASQAKTLGTSVGAAGSAEANDALTATFEKMQASLQRQLAALTASREEMALYDAQVAGLTQTQQNELAAIADTITLRKEEIALATEAAAAIEAEAAAAALGVTATSSFTRELLVIFRELTEGRLTYAFASFTRLLSFTNLLGLALNPITIGIGLLGFAAVKGAEQVTALSTALASTGNSAGTSADELETLAQKIGDSGVRTGVAIDALTKLAETGKFTADQITEIGTAASEFADVTGTAVDKVVQEFVKLQGDPVKASVELNNQYHYLTLAVFDQIDALAKQGDTVAAVDAAEKAYADSLKTRADDIKESLGYVQRAWDAIKDAASSAWNAMLGVGKQQTLEEQLAAAQKAAADQEPVLFGEFGQTGVAQSQAQQRVRDLEAQIAARKAQEAKQATDAATQQQGIAGRQVIDRLEQEFDKRTKLTKALDEEAAAEKALAAAGKPVSQQEHAQLVADINKRYTQKTPGAAGIPGAIENQQVKQIQDQLKEIQDAYKTTQADLNSQHQAGLVSDTSYYSQEKALNDKHLSDLLDNYAKQIAALKQGTPGETAKQRIDDQTKINALQTQATNAITDYLKTYSTLSSAQTAADTKRITLAQDYEKHLEDQLDQRKAALDVDIQAMGMGAREAALLKANVEAQKEYNSAVEKTLNTYASSRKTPDDQATRDQNLAGQKKLLTDTVAANADAYEKMTKAQEDWAAGAKKAWQDWADNADNLNTEVGSVTTTAFNGMTDSLTTFVTTGKLSFTSLADSIIKDLARIAVQFAESQALQAIFGAFLGSTGSAAGTAVTATSTAGSFGQSLSGIGSSGVATSFSGSALGYATGGYISGPGSGTSDSINAKLSNGEFVVNAAATAANRPLLEAMNGGKSTPGQTHFATGGFVGSAPNQVNGGTSIVFNIASASSQSGPQAQAGPQQAAKTAAMQKELEVAVIQIVRKHSEPGGTINKIVKQISR